MVVDEFLEKGKPKHLLLKHVGLARSSYYYTSTGTKAGKRPANYVYDNEGSSHDLKYVTERISELLSGEFVNYGYCKTYRYLNDELGLNIGFYRTYNLMKQNGLLKFQRDKKKRSNRNWVKELVPNVASEFSFLEFDIKYVYIQETRTNTQVLTIIDVYSRWVLGQYIANSIKSEDVIKLFQVLFENYPLPEQFIVRNDNGSQFEALTVQEFLKNKGVIQEFTNPATPEQNAHIESYHSIMESAVCQRFEFQNLQDFQDRKIKVIFFGSKNNFSVIKRISKINPELLKHISLTEKIPQNNVLYNLNNSHVLLVLSSSKHVALPAKVFEYIGLEKYILVSTNDKSDVERFVKETSSGIICNDSSDVYNSLVSFFSLFENDRKMKIKIFNKEYYSRKHQSKLLSDTIKKLI